MPRPPCNLHLVATWRSPDNAICKSTQHDTSRVLHLPYEITMEVAKVLRLPLKLQLIFLKRRTYHTKQFSTHYETCWSVTKCHACHAKRGYVALETSIKWSLFAELAIGTAIRASDDRPRTVAVVNATSGEHTFNQSETGTLATHLGETSVLGQFLSVCSMLILHIVRTNSIETWPQPLCKWWSVGKTTAKFVERQEVL